jgi:hypothetical protein
MPIIRKTLLLFGLIALIIMRLTYFRKKQAPDAKLSVINDLEES